jgi:hypothetical protein
LADLEKLVILRNLPDLVNSVEEKTFGTLAEEAEEYDNHTLDGRVAKFNEKSKVSSWNSIPKDCSALSKKLKVHISMDPVV